MSDTESHIPKKKNMAFETIKDCLAFVGGSTILAAIGSSIYNSRNEKSIKPCSPNIVLKAMNLPIGIYMLVGGLSIWKTSEYNNNIDELTKKNPASFASRIEQENAAAASPSVPSR